MVVAALADPVTCSLMGLLDVARMLAVLLEFERRFQRSVRGLWLVLSFCGVNLECLEPHCALVLLQFEGCLITTFGLDEV